MSKVEEIWRRKSDDEVAKAGGCLSDYTEEGQAAIRAELRRRGLPEPPLARTTPAKEPLMGKRAVTIAESRYPHEAHVLRRAGTSPALEPH